MGISTWVRKPQVFPILDQAVAPIVKLRSIRSLKSAFVLSTAGVGLFAQRILNELPTGELTFRLIEDCSYADQLSVTAFAVATAEDLFCRLLAKTLRGACCCGCI